ncbi:MAG: response regulator, partial [Chloroflexi bacterium]|nr:response regulator [Chloroflexota bacterium]
RLPGMTGLEAVRAIKADPDLKTTRIILLSTVLGNRDAALAAGAETYLAKPFRVRELRAAVQRVIGPGEIDLAS